MDIDKLKTAIESFKGVRRRFEYVIKNNEQVYIDDYAHHPTELNAAISTARALFPKRNVVVVFAHKVLPLVLPNNSCGCVGQQPLRYVQ